MSTLAIKVNLAQVLSSIDAVAVQCEAAARPAAQAGAQVLYDEVRRNVGRIKRHTGNLAASIYQAYSANRSVDGHQVYHVSWNARKAPHGHLVEFGHLQRYEVSHDEVTGRFITHKDRIIAPKFISAKPFVRPAQARFDAARQAMRERFLQELAQRGVVK